MPCCRRTTAPTSRCASAASTNCSISWTLPNSSSLLLDSVVLSFAKLVSVSLSCCPWPSSCLAESSIRLDNEPSLFAPLGPSATDRSSSDLKISSSSTGTAVRSMPSLALFGQHRAAGVGRRELHEAVADDGRRDDDGLDVGGQPHVGLVRERHLDVVALGLQLLDLAHGHAEDADVRALVERVRAREVDRERAIRAVPGEDEDDGDDQRHHDEDGEDLGEAGEAREEVHQPPPTSM